MTTSPQNSHSHPWLTVSCCALSMAVFFLGLLGLWPTYGPSLILALFLIAAGPVIAFGKRANVEATGFRAVTIMASVACGLVALSRPIRIIPSLRLRFGIIASVTRSSSKKKARIMSTPACANLLTRSNT